MTLLKTKNEAKGGYIQKRTLGKGQHTNSNRQARQGSRGLLAIKRGGGAWDPDSRTGTAVAKGVLDRGKTRGQAIATASETKSQTLAGKADGMDVLLGTSNLNIAIRRG